MTNALKEAGVQFEYEPVWLTYVPRKEKKYKPDIVLANGIVVELKGEFTSADRTKHLDVRAAHPDVDLRFVFSRAATKISKQSKTTYGAWCDYKGIRYADKRIPAEWLAEPPNLASIAAIKQLTRVGGE